MYYSKEFDLIYVGDKMVGDEPATAEQLAARDAKTETANTPKEITRSQCALEMYALKWIDANECLDMTKNGQAPKIVTSIFEQMLANGIVTAEQRIILDVQFARDTYNIDNALLRQVVAALGESGIDIYGFFRAAAQL